jgi:hypothetical protein
MKKWLPHPTWDSPTSWGKALSFSTPEVMDRPKTLARKLVKMMTAGRKSAGVWHGPLQGHPN